MLTSKLFVFSIFFGVALANQSGCQLNSTRLIVVEDIEGSFVQDTTYDGDLAILLSLSPMNVAGYYYGYANKLPNFGYIRFKQPFLFTGFTTKGDTGGGGSLDYRYVSRFSVEAVSNDTTEFRNYSQIFSVNSLHEAYFPIYPPVLTSELSFTVLEAVGSTYYWNMNLFGCEKTDVVSQTQCSDRTFASSADTSSSSSKMHAETSIIVGTSSAPSNYHFTTMTIIPSNYQCTTSTVIRYTESNTYSSCSSSVRVNQANRLSSESNSQQAAVVVAILIPLLFIIAILLAVIVLLLMYINRKRRDITLNHSESQGGGNTLKAVNNAGSLYTAKEISVVNKDDDLMNNDMYLCSSGQVLLKIGNEDHYESCHNPSQEAEYSAVQDDPDPLNIADENEYIYSAPNDNPPTTTTVNASSNTYEYVSTDAASHPQLQIDQVESTVNPSYQSINM